MPSSMDENPPELHVIMTIKSGAQSSKVRIEMQPIFEDPMCWGIIFVDAMRITADSYAKEEGATSIEPYLNRIKEGFDLEFNNYTSPIEFIGPVEDEKQ